MLFIGEVTKRINQPPEINRKTMVLSDDIPEIEFGSDFSSEHDFDYLLNWGVINLNKPMGPTSHQVSSWVKHIFGVEKVGHGGTLDPRVTGVLPMAFSKSARLLYVFTYSSKEYIGVMRLHQDVPEKRVKQICEEFVGPIYQFPPVRSAVKRQLRVRTIYSFKVLEQKGRDILFDVVCEAGTYIRTLAKDIGIALGKGAHMQELRRIRTGPFHENDSITLHELKDAVVFWQEEKDETLLRKYIHPFDSILSDLPKIIIHDSAVDAICHGAKLALPGIIQFEEIRHKGEPVVVYTRKGESVAMGEAIMVTGDIMSSDSGIVMNTKRVLMPAGTYQKSWKKKTKE